jgi:putative membrane protein
MMFGGIGMLLFWVLVIGLVVLAVRGLAGNGSHAQPSAGTTDRQQRTPLEIAQARYASGEISREEYEALRRDLQSS